MRKTKILLYGANGFTASLMLHKLQTLKAEIILAGRSKDIIKPLAKEYGYGARVFSLERADVVAKNLDDIGLLLNCAGPFSKTALPLAQACIATGCHYFDITGELGVFKSLHRLDQQAKSRGVSIIPGMGFDIVPTDCLGKMLAQKMPQALSLDVAIVTKNTRPSHGTLKTALLEINFSSQARRHGGIIDSRTIAPQKTVSLNGRAITCVRAPLADLFCAPLSTGIEQVDTFLALPKQMTMFTPALNIVRKLSRHTVINKLITAAIERLPNGPTTLQQERGSAYIFGEVRGQNGRIVNGVLKTPEPYVYTGDALMAGARRFLVDGLKPGFQTPSLAFGADFALAVNSDGTHVEITG